MQDQAKNSDSNEKKQTNRGWSVHTNITKWTQQQINHNLYANDNTNKPSSVMDGRVKTNHKIIIYKNDKHNQTKQATEGENDK